MYRRLILSLAVVYSGSPGAWAKTETRRIPKQYTPEQFRASTSDSGSSFSPDERLLLVTSNRSGIYNVYAAPTAGGPLKPITHSTTESTFGVSFFPRDERLLFSHDQGGNENSHLYVRELEGSERDLTPGEKVKAAFNGWSHDLRFLYVQTNERDPKYFDLYRYDSQTYQRELLYKNESGYVIGSVSDDARWLSLQKIHSNEDNDLFLYNLSNDQTKRISEHTGKALYSSTGFDRDGNLYYLTNQGSEFNQLRRYVLETGRDEEVQRAPWDIQFNTFSWNGKYRVVGINQDARTVISVYDAHSNQPVPLPKLPEGEIGAVAISRSETQMVFRSRSDRTPGSLYVYNFANRKLTRLTDGLSKEIDPNDLVHSQVIRFKAFDGLDIPAILYKPHSADPSHKAPALVYVHGGPGGQTVVGYSPTIQLLANHGYVVLGINNRGSSGYGKTFFHADDRRHGREPLWDCVSAKTYLASLTYVDRDRIGIVGGSYGGYMVLAALAFRPEVFAVGVDLFGVANWVRTLASVPSWWEAQRQSLYSEIGDPVKDKKMLEENSPLLHASEIRKPLLVLQGANDPRVIKPESDDIVAAVKKNGVPAEYVVFDDEGHGFTKKKNELVADHAILDFLDKYLKATGTRTAQR